jgi:LCP family protein required for cell wall assembly
MVTRRSQPTSIDLLIHALTLAVLVVGAVGLWDAFQPLGTISVHGVQVPSVFSFNPWAGRTRVGILLLGVDERPWLQDVGRSDTMLAVLLNPSTQQAAVLSVPRDMRAEIPGHGQQRINAAYSLGERDEIGGAELCRQTVEQLLGVPLEYYVTVNFEGFQHIVDLLGGVDIDVEKRMKYDDNWGHLHINLQPGLQHLNGEQAMGYVRYRLDSDYERMRRQREFLQAMADQTIRARNLLRLLRVVPEIESALQTNLSAGELQAVVKLAKDMDPAAVLGSQLPVYDVSRHPFLSALDQAGLATLMRQTEEHLDSPPAAPTTVELVNAGGLEGAASDAAARLQPKGFTIVAVGNAEEFGRRETEIRYQPGQIHTAQWIARILGCGEPAPETDALTYYSMNAQIRVTLGRDYELSAPPTTRADADPSRTGQGGGP